jgi:peroxiredoxin Q/BCP
MIAGDKAPDFTLYDHAGRPRSLSEFLAEGPVVLFFFPLASSPICTAQACHFRDLSTEFASVGAQRLGISTDAVDRQAHFAQQRKFDYPLLSDADGVVSEMFGVRRGRLAKLRESVVTMESARRRRHTRRRGLLARLLPVRRTTFVIDTDRTVLKVVSSELRASVHADQALWFLQNYKLSRRAPPGQSAHQPSESDWFTEPKTTDKPDVAVPLEAPVETLRTTSHPPRWPKHDVRGQILTCCMQSRSVAEIAAQLSLPLGATRFLVGELVAQGFLQANAMPGDSMPIDERRDLIERTLRGLRALSASTETRK